MKFELWLSENERSNGHKNKIDIFDFDDTLFHAPTKEQARCVMNRHNAELGLHELPGMELISRYANYWSHPMSLEPPVVPSPCPHRLLNQPIAREFYKSSRDPKRLTIIMTGRPPHLKQQLTRILDDFKMKPERLHMMPMAGYTIDNKLDHLRNLLDELPHIMDVEMWDDRGPKKAKLTGDPLENHIKIFKDFLQSIHDERQNKDKTHSLKFKVNEILPRDEIIPELMRKHPDHGKKK